MSVSQEARPAHLEVRPLTIRIGAEIAGIDLRDEPRDEVIAELRATLLRHRVVFLRDQTIGIEQQTAFARRFGDLTASHPTVRATNDAAQVYEINSLEGARADEWHTDVTYTDRPPAISVLRGVVIPPVGGDTMWANTVIALSDLPEQLRSYLETLRVVHTNRQRAAASGQPMDEAARRHMAEFQSTAFETEHPVVRVHPETGEHSLLLGAFADQIVGLDHDASRDLLRQLSAAVTRPENTVRWRWRPGDVVMWDNRSTQHYAVHDYGDIHRVVQRVTVAGAIPVGVDGSQSRVLSGDASSYSAVGRA